ncbi:MAG: ADP-forming succinate--CoA ligase subunit beta [Nitrospirota bacterium]
MKIHEYQAKEMMSAIGISVPIGRVASSQEEARDIIAWHKSDRLVIKAQVHAGGRGKGGGILLAESKDQAVEAANKILGMRLVTHQTGPEGIAVRKILIEETTDIKKELYIGIAIDRERGEPAVIASNQGGVEIEELIKNSPDLLIKEKIDASDRIYPFKSRRLSYRLFGGSPVSREIDSLVQKLVKFFIRYDCSLAEINPLAITADDRLLVLDAKINFDDNALFRHEDIRELRDFNEEDPLEVKASSHGLSYIRLQGNIGCMVNGAGLAMATMDLIKKSGGEPANFLDVGGGASAEQVGHALGILLSDKNVKVILVNIFGGIMRCDLLARGIIDAAEKIKVDLPLVIRLKGTNLEEGKAILRSSGLSFILAETMADAAERAVSLAK